MPNLLKLLDALVDQLLGIIARGFVPGLLALVLLQFAPERELQDMPLSEIPASAAVELLVLTLVSVYIFVWVLIGGRDNDDR